MRRKKLKKQQIYCGQDFRDWEGYRILQVQSDDLDRNVRIKLINETGHIVKLFLDDLCFDGETMTESEVEAYQTMERRNIDGKKKENGQQGPCIENRRKSE